MAGPQRFFDPSQPQTLQIATILLYIQGVFAFLGLSLLFAAGYGGAGFGIANGKKWGYALAVVMAALQLLSIVAGQSLTTVLRSPNGTVELMFAIALLALVLHPQSREYQKIWFS